jgi:hypothetical protein
MFEKVIVGNKDLMADNQPGKVKIAQVAKE